MLVTDTVNNCRPISDNTVAFMFVAIYDNADLLIVVLKLYFA